MAICRTITRLSIVGSDVKETDEHLGMKNVGIDNLFIFLNILWKYDEWKKEFPYSATGVFLAAVIVTSLWIHFLLNELKECNPIDSMLLRPFIRI